MSTTSTQRLYALFVHYGIPPEVIKLLSEQGSSGEPVPSFERRFRQEMLYLSGILRPEAGWKGLALVFVDNGWAGLVELMGAHARSQRTAARGESKIDLIERGARLKALRERLESLLPAGHAGRIRLVTASDLLDLLKSLEDCLPVNLHERLWLYLAGKRRKLLYDAPKVIEAAVRIANIGSHKPIFRFDHDVLFSACCAEPPVKARLERAAAELRKNIRRLCAHHDALTQDPGVSYFVFSGAYCDRSQRARIEKPSGPPASAVLQDGFATRVYQLARVGKAKEEPVLNCQASASFLRSLYTLGGNPFRQVISGAGLCLSDGAILDLPPFCNMRQNVVWIDDHLKYALHHELFHFGYQQGTRQIASVPQAVFSQKRGNLTAKTVYETLSDYMPRLIRGCIVDSWLRADPRLKLETVSLPRKQFSAIKQKLGAAGSYAAFFREAVRHGEDWDRKEKQQWHAMKRRLWDRASARIEELVEEWSLNTYSETWLHAYATGGAVWQRVPSVLQPSGSQATGQAVPSLAEVRDGLRGTRYPGSKTDRTHVWLRMLVDDFMTYIKVARFWRHFVFAVRALLNSPKLNPSQRDWLVLSDGGAGGQAGRRSASRSRR